MSGLLFTCFALVWVLSGCQYLYFRGGVSRDPEQISFVAFMVTSVLFVAGGGAWVAWLIV